MDEQLKNKLVGILVADGVDAGRFSTLLDALRGAGADCRVVGPKAGEIRSWSPSGWGDPIQVDQAISDADADHYDALVVAGGQIAADTLRQNHAAVDMVRRTIESGRPLAIIGHAAWLLAETDLVTGMEVTGTPSIKTDLRASGAFWSDDTVVVDQGVITVQSSTALEEALPRIVEEFAEGTHDRPGITDVVTESSEESFPASDPPSWEPGASTRSERQ